MRSSDFFDFLEYLLFLFLVFLFGYLTGSVLFEVF